MIWATLDDDGRPTGFYDERIHGDAIPAEAVEISEEDRAEALVNPGCRRIDEDGSLVPCDPPPIPQVAADELLADAQAEVEARLAADPMMSVLVDLVAAGNRISREEIAQRVAQAMRGE